MNDLTLDDMYEDLWRRWYELYDIPPDTKIPDWPQELVRQTTAHNAYDIRNYQPGKMFLRRKPGASSSQYYTYEYYLDELKRPVLCKCVNHDGQPVMFYHYSGHDVIKYEINPDTRICSDYVRRTFIEDRTMTMQHLQMHLCVGSTYMKLTGPDLRERFRSNMRIRNIYLHKHNYDDDGRAASYDLLCEESNWTRKIWTVTYQYDDNGVQSDNWSCKLPCKTIRYAKPGAKPKPDPLVEALIVKIADWTLQFLAKGNYSSPLQFVMMSYTSMENYAPGISVATTQYSIPNLMLYLGSTAPDNCVLIPETELKPEYKKLMRKMEQAEDFDAGRTMLRRAAKLVTERAAQQMNVAEDFFAFAVDWEEDATDVEDMLLECGASAANIEGYKQRGWV